MKFLKPFLSETIDSIKMPFSLIDNSSQEEQLLFLLSQLSPFAIVSF